MSLSLFLSRSHKGFEASSGHGNSKTWVTKDQKTPNAVKGWADGYVVFEEFKQGKAFWGYIGRDWWWRRHLRRFVYYSKVVCYTCIWLDVIRCEWLLFLLLSFGLDLTSGAVDWNEMEIENWRFEIGYWRLEILEEDIVYWILDIEGLNIEDWILVLGYWPWILDFGLWMLNRTIRDWICE